MLGKIFYNIIIFGTIISICIFPLLVFLSKNKYKYNFKSIYKVFIFILLSMLLSISIIVLSFSNLISGILAMFPSFSIISSDFVHIRFFICEKSAILIGKINNIKIKIKTL